MDKTTFYASLRRRESGVFGTSLSQKQVDGVEAVLEECRLRRVGPHQTAYVLATAYGETGGKMQPCYENLYYSAKRIPQVFSKRRRQGVPVAKLARNPQLLANTVYGGVWGAENLGNVARGDGWRFRGTGMGQITGRRNFNKWGTRMKLPLTERPDLLMDLQISAKALVQPMLEGWATGHKLGQYVTAERQDYYNARRTWNGTFDAKKYAGYARAFEAALIAGHWSAHTDRVRPEIIDYAPEAPAAREVPGTPSRIAALVGWLSSLFAKRNSK